MSMNRPQPCVRNAMSAKTTFRTNLRCRVRIASVLLNCDELWKKSLKSCFHDQQTNLSHHEVRARCGEHIQSCPRVVARPQQPGQGAPRSRGEDGVANPQTHRLVPLPLCRSHCCSEVRSFPSVTARRRIRTRVASPRPPSRRPPDHDPPPPRELYSALEQKYTPGCLYREGRATTVVRFRSVPSSSKEMSTVSKKSRRDSSPVRS